MTCTEGREPSGLAMISLSRVLGDVRRSPTETMTHSKLLTVEDVFDISGRGLVVVPGPPVDSFASPQKLSVLLKLPDGRELSADASITHQFQTPPPKEHRYAVVLDALTKSDVPIGTEIWIANESGE